MQITLTLPDTLPKLAPLQQLDAIVNAAMTVLLTIASDPQAQHAATAAAAIAVVAPWGVDSYGLPFATEKEALTYAAAVAKRDENLGNSAAEEAANYHGSIDPDTLGLYDWAFYVKTAHLVNGSQNYVIFTKRPIVRDKDTGRVLQNPHAELAAVDVSGYGGPLAAFA